MRDKIDKIYDDLTELKISSVKQNEILERLTESVEYHIKRTDALEDLHAILKEDMIRARAEHELTKTLLTANIQSQKDKATHKNELLTKTLTTILSTLIAVGGFLLALHELGILKKLIQ